MIDNINESKKVINPRIITDVSGKVIYENKKAFRSLKSLRIGDDVSKLIDIDYIRKFSMYDSRMDIIKTQLKRYDRAVIKVLGSGMQKSVEICFLSKNEKVETRMLDEKKMLAIFAEITYDNSMKDIIPSEFLKEIISRVTNRVEFRNRVIQYEIENDGSFYTKNSLLEVLCISTIYMLNEANYKEPIRIKFAKKEESLQVKASVRVNKEEMDGVQKIGSSFPFIITKLIFVNSLCEDNNIDFSIYVKDSTLCVNYNINEEKKSLIGAKFSLKNKTPRENDTHRLSRYIDSIAISIKDLSPSVKE